MEKESPLKLEFSEGEIFALAGGPPEHGALAMRFVALVASQLDATCTLYSSDVKIRIEATDLATYPDVSIVCGERQHAPNDANAIVNPKIVVEVTSPSSEAYDCGDNLSQYKQLAALDAVVLISHRRKQVTLVQRDNSRWQIREYRAGEIVQITDTLRFAVNDLYQVTPNMV